MKYIIDRIGKIYDKTYDGKPLISQFGKPYKKADIYLKGDDRKMTLFLYKGDVKEGQEIEGEIQSKTGTGQWAGKTFYTFKELSQKDKTTTELGAIKTTLGKHEFLFNEVASFLKKKFPADFPKTLEVKVPTFTPNTPEQAKQWSVDMKKHEEEALNQFKVEDLNADEIPF